MIEVGTEKESQVIFDVNEDYFFEIRRSAYPQLWTDDQGNVFKQSKKGGIFAPKAWINNAGYEIVNTTRPDGKSTTVPVQRVVATAWLPNPLGLSDVDHLDDDQLNNSVDNLQWLSHRDNLRKHHRNCQMTGHGSPVTGRMVIKVSRDGQQEQCYRSISAAARANHLSFSSVRGNAAHTLDLDKNYHFEFADMEAE